MTKFGMAVQIHNLVGKYLMTGHCHKLYYYLL